MLVKVELNEKERGELSPIRKNNATLAKYTDDAGDVKMFASPDGTKKYLRVWETIPAKADAKQGGSATYVKTFYEVQAPARAIIAEVVADVK